MYWYIVLVCTLIATSIVFSGCITHTSSNKPTFLLLSQMKQVYISQKNQVYNLSRAGGKEMKEMRQIWRICENLKDCSIFIYFFLMSVMKHFFPTPYRPRWIYHTADELSGSITCIDSSKALREP